ncbi:unnamed protein product [Ceutorhynchus assimilis]|uniref:Uncharacterized protein n=1 Tax=Ceutorhynchus assimilis TaxID=467358 RepID=A0A9N9MS58_9CUCU|nr:unnamed protein product [Ceutorhynchus assimilis]
MNKMSGDIHNRVENVPDLPEPENDDHPSESFNNDLSKTTRTLTGDFLVPTTVRNNQISFVRTASDGSLCCDICNIKVSGSKIFQKHLEGKRHKSKVDRLGKTFNCNICDVTANSEIQLNIHLSSSKHKSRVEKEEIKELFDGSSYSNSVYVIFFAVLCIVINLILLFRVAD